MLQPFTRAAAVVQAVVQVQVEEVAAVLVLAELQKKEQEKKRNYWIHPLLQDRSEKGLFYTLYGDLRSHPDKFFIFARMSISSFDELVCSLQARLKGCDTNVRKSISPVEKVLLTLR